MKVNFFLLVFLGVAVSISGCGLLIGNVKPLSQKSNNYDVMNLSKNSNWIDISENSESSDDTSLSDFAYQSSETESVIALNSACREQKNRSEKSLKEFTDLLLLGVSKVSERTERPMTIENLDALETNIIGQVDSRTVKMQTIVLKSKSCVFDFLYLSTPANFSKEHSVFSSFVASFRLD